MTTDAGRRLAVELVSLCFHKNSLTEVLRCSVCSLILEMRSSPFTLIVGQKDEKLVSAPASSAGSRFLRSLTNGGHTS